MLFKKTVRVLIKELKNKAILNLEQSVISCYVTLVAYSNYFETVSTMMNQTHFQVAMFAFNTVLLYDYYYIITIWYNMCSAWFLDIRISTCITRLLLQ